jgi:hypothetical protein
MHSQRQTTVSSVIAHLGARPGERSRETAGETPQLLQAPQIFRCVRRGGADIGQQRRGQTPGHLGAVGAPTITTRVRLGAVMAIFPALPSAAACQVLWAWNRP